MQIREILYGDRNLLRSYDASLAELKLELDVIKQRIEVDYDF